MPAAIERRDDNDWLNQSVFAIGEGPPAVGKALSETMIEEKPRTYGDGL
jgi:hypothetical protein